MAPVPSKPYDLLAGLLRPILVLLAVTLAGCGENQGEVAAGPPDEVTYAADLNVDLQQMEMTPSGLYFRDIAEGTGPAATPGSPVRVHYTGWLPNGQQFDSSQGGAPFEFRLGVGEVIEGWDEGVAGMRPGGRRQLVIPPNLAYGERGAGGVIPPDATLVFEVELLEIL